MDLEEQLLTAAIRETLQEGGRAVGQLFDLQLRSTQENVEEGDHADALDEAGELLAFHIEKAFRDTAILAERLGLPIFARKVAEVRAEFATVRGIDLILINEDPYSKSLSAVRSLFDSLATMVDGRGLTGLAVFERVLQSTGQIIDAAGLTPSNEAKVRAKVREVLGFCFHGVVREIPIAKSLKTYKPDIGVIPLAAAAEYKFVDNRSEATKVLDEIYADMKGYSGRYDWRSFYAVIYMTQPFYTQADVEQEFRLVKAELSWTPYVVVGPGGRIARPKSAIRPYGKRR